MAAEPSAPDAWSMPASGTPSARPVAARATPTRATPTGPALAPAPAPPPPSHRAQATSYAWGQRPPQLPTAYPTPVSAPSSGFYDPSRQSAPQPSPPPQSADVAIPAEEDEEPSPPFFDLAVVTYVPLSVGGQLSLELPARILLQADVGWMPHAYGSLINGLVSRWGAYDPAIAALVDGVLDDALVVRASAGWRPFPSAGFEMIGGYTMVRLTGSIAPGDLAAAVQSDLGDEAAAVLGTQLGDEVGLVSQLHNFHVALGWRWVAFDHLLIRANIGYTQTLASKSSVKTDKPDLEALVNPVVDEELGAIYKRYVKLPVVGVSAGYRF